MSITLQREPGDAQAGKGATALFLGNANLILAILLAAVGSVLWRVPMQDVAATATFIGALFGGAALLLAGWIGQAHEKGRAEDANRQRKDKLKILIAAELTTIAVGLMDSKTRVDAALASYQPSEERPSHGVDLTRWLPRAMDLTESLWSEVLLLDRRAVDALALLRSNLLLTSASMTEAASAGRPASSRIEAVASEIRFDLGVLAQAFECIAPTRQIELSGQPAELASVLMRRLSLDPVPASSPAKPSWWHGLDDLH